MEDGVEKCSGLMVSLLPTTSLPHNHMICAIYMPSKEPFLEVRRQL